MIAKFCTIAGLSAALLHAQSTPDLARVMERLDRLEKQNEALMSEIQALRKQLGAETAGAVAAVPSAPAAQPTEPPVEERLDVQESRIAELAQSKVGTSQHMPVQLTGMLLFNAFANGRYGGGLQDPVTASLTPGSTNTGATFRQTVLGLKFDGPNLPGGGKSSGSFFMDFWGGTSAPNNNLFRVRLATISLTWKNTTIAAGQDKPIVAPREPMSLAQVGLSPLTGAGNLWDWNPQLRLEQNLPFNSQTGIHAEAGIFEVTDSAPTSAPTAVTERWRPGYEGRFNFYAGGENRRFEIAPGFHFSSSHVAGQTAPSRLVTLDWLARPVRTFEITGAFFKGENAAGLGGLRQGFTILPGGKVIPVHVTGGWGQLALFPASRLSFHLYGGVESDRTADLVVNGVSRNFIWAGNAIYKLAPNVLAAFEVSQNRTTYVASGRRLNDHYDLALAYLF